MALALPCIDVLLRIAGYRRLLGWIERFTPQAGTKPFAREGIITGETLARHATMASGQIPCFNTSCLRQSLLVYWRLRQSGLAPELKLGVRKQGESIDAHAWVELQGHSLSPAPILHQPFALRDRNT